VVSFSIVVVTGCCWFIRWDCIARSQSQREEETPGAEGEREAGSEKQETNKPSFFFFFLTPIQRIFDNCSAHKNLVGISSASGSNLATPLGLFDIVNGSLPLALLHKAIESVE